MFNNEMSTLFSCLYGIKTVVLQSLLNMCTHGGLGERSPPK